MAGKGSTHRRFRLDDDALWKDYAAACVEIHGSTDRSDDLRAHIDRTVAEWRRRTGAAPEGADPPPDPGLE